MNQDNPLFSIIIPCYNCADTLEEAVNSIYTQNLSISYEVIMVDDGSTQEGTRRLMKALAEKYPAISCYFHESNRGGGAARNTGISKAVGEIIYCLDSDNVLAPNSLQKMIDFLHEKKCDGVIFHERRFFIGKKIRNYSSQVNAIIDRPIALEDIFNDSGTLLDNFIFTKASWFKAGGFPEHHGFDTQGFEMRYLAVGNTAYVCKGSIFYHRQAQKKASYFEREYNAGNFSLYYYLCIEDIFDRLIPEAQEFIMNYDVFKNSSFKKNLSLELKRLEKDGRLFKKTGSTESPGAKRYAEAITAYKKGDYKQSLDIIAEIISTFPYGKGKLMYYNGLRCIMGLSGVEKNSIEKATSGKIKDMIIEPRKLYKAYHRYPAIHKALRIIQKWKK